MDNRIKRLKKKALNLPKTPGVYLMKNKAGEIIYVGKAKALKNRVNSYFTAIESHTDKVYSMIMNVEDFDYILTDSEFEALVLECSLIKQHSPKYNILLKDDKGYHYIKVTNEPYRRIKEAKQKLDDGSLYIGPYTSMFTLSQSIDEAVKIFKLPTCNLKLTGKKVRKRPCLNYYINQCKAPCQGNISQVEHNESVEEALNFLGGDSQKCITNLKTKMIKYSEELRFEKAAEVRDRINAIQKLQDEQKIVATKIREQDIIAFAQSNKHCCFVVLKFSNYRLTDKEQFFIDKVDDEKSARGEFIKRYYYMKDEIPHNISVDNEVEDIDTIEIWLSDKASKKVKIFIPQRGEQAKLVNMCKKNAYEALAQKEGKISGKETEALNQLSELLNLDKIPMYIEAYDISNLRGTDNVAGMVVFEGAKPLKSAYKRFKIKNIDGQDDYGSMQEAIERRFNHYKDENNKDIGFAKLPDLILLDGGKGHVNVVKQVLDKQGIDVPIFGMVKDSKHRTRAIAYDGAEISIKNNRTVFDFITRIQDEVHRYAVSYHHISRKNDTLTSILTEIDGIGNKKATYLLRYFKSINKIKSAKKEELCKVKSISKNDAEKICEFFS